MTMLFALMRTDTLARTAALKALAQFRSPKKSSALRPDRPAEAWICTSCLTVLVGEAVGLLVGWDVGSRVGWPVG